MKLEKEIKNIIKKSSSVFIVGHKNLDLDAIGACVGIATICKKFNKPHYIIVDDEKHELGVSKILTEIKSNIKIIKSSDIDQYKQENSILIVVDTNKPHLMQNENLKEKFKNIIVFDHHQPTDQTFKNTFNIISEESSSACEIIMTFIKKYNINLTPLEATIILAGIVLDTRNFTVKTTKNTYYMAYYLTKFEADPKKVQYYLKQDIKDYIIRQKVITGVKIINDKYAVTMSKSKQKYKREELAKIADTLLQFEGIEASFVLGIREDGGIGLSARSNGNVNVGLIAENFGGGGDITDAAAQILNKKIKEVYEEVLKIIK